MYRQPEHFNPPAFFIPLLLIFIGISILTVMYLSVQGEAEPVVQSPSVLSPSDAPTPPTATASTAADDLPSEYEIRLSSAAEIVSQMTDEQLAGQVILVRGNNAGLDDVCALISSIHAGGVVLFADNFEGKSPDEIRQMNAALQQAGGGELLLCVDEEGGRVVRVSSNSALRSEPFKSPQQLYASGRLDAIMADTHEKCQFLLDLGINVNFAPVADVVTDPGGFLYDRSIGMGAQSTAAYVDAVVSVMNQYPIGSSIKHFPGYGNSHGDTHGELVTSTVTAESLRSIDLVPFAAGIAAGADSVMLTHTIVDALDSRRPASLSPAAVSLLRGEMGFEGVLITDGLDMDAISIYCGQLDPGTAAIGAGLDLLCTPADARATHSALLSALESGQLPRERLRDAAAHVVAWKLRLGLMS